MADEIKIISIIGEVVRLGDSYPDPVIHKNEDDTEVAVIYLDVRADGARYKVQLRGDRTIEAFQSGEFFNRIDGQWYVFNPPTLGDWINVKGSFSIKPPTKNFDREQYQLICWEPWNVKLQQIGKRPSKKKMTAW